MASSTGFMAMNQLEQLSPTLYEYSTVIRWVVGTLISILILVIFFKLMSSLGKSSSNQKACARPPGATSPAAVQNDGRQWDSGIGSQTSNPFVSSDGILGSSASPVSTNQCQVPQANTQPLLQTQAPICYNTC